MVSEIVGDKVFVFRADIRDGAQPLDRARDHLKAMREILEKGWPFASISLAGAE
jgi:hypothetical protein